MKTLLLSTLALTLAVASPALASGCGGNKGGNRGGNYGGIYGGNRGNVVYGNQNCNTNYGGNYQNGGNYLQNGQGYEPFHSYYVTQPGDTFYEVSLKEYGTSAAMQYIARYNRLATTSALVPGQRLMLPSISRTGALSASRAPAPGNANASTPKFAQPQQTAASSTPASDVGFAKNEEVALPNVSAGSTISLDGVPFGKESGSVRVKLGPVSVPATVVEWTAESVTVQLPTVDLDSPTPASIDVFKADGELASQSQVKLTPAGTQVVQAE